MTSPRSTRLVRVPTLGAFRQACVDLTSGLDALALRRCAVLVPTHAAGEYLRRTLEARWLPARGAAVFPHLFTRADWLAWLSRHVAAAPALSAHEREVILGAAAHDTREAGVVPPFSLRPSLLGELLAFYDALRRQLKTVDDFERLASARFERDADVDRGAARLLAQARFMVETFRAYERRLADLARPDEHALRERILDEPDTPLRHVIVTVGDRAAEPAGLFPADFDLLARINGVERIDVVATDATLASGFLQRLRDQLPGINETAGTGTGTGTGTAAPPAVLLAPPEPDTRLFHVFRDREDELEWMARRIKRTAREAPGEPLARTAIVFKRPLPYVYLASQVFPSAGVPYETFDALPLASEAFAAVIDLIAENVSTGFARPSLIALMRSPHVRVELEGQRVTPADVNRLDAALADAHYLGDPARLVRLAGEWTDSVTGDSATVTARLARAGRAAAAMCAELAALAADHPPATAIDVVLAFLQAHERHVAGTDDSRQRHARARAAVLATLTGLRDAYRAIDDRRRPFGETAATVLRFLERQTFAPHAGHGGVQLTDAAAARYGDFDTIYLAGLIQREWPDVPRRNIFFPPSMLQDLGWPGDTDTRAAERAAFGDLVRSAGRRAMVSTFTLEDDGIVEPSPFLEDLTEASLAVERPPAAPAARLTSWDALTGPDVRGDAVGGEARAWLAVRLSRTAPSDPRYHGSTPAATRSSYRVSALDRYIECPFIFFAEQVLGIAEDPTDEEGVGPREQGRIVHEVFQRFFEEWQASGGDAITAGNVDVARRLFATTVAARLEPLPDGDAAILRQRLLGSPVAPGLGDIVFRIEAERPAVVTERLLEFPLTGPTRLGAGGTSRTIELRATADRVDLLSDGTFRVLDYKLTRAPEVKHAVQLPAYAAAARERLAGRRDSDWVPSDAAYVAFGKPPYYHPLTRDPADLPEALAAGEARLLSAVDDIERGAFPPRPRQLRQCGFCAYSLVCRTDYVDEP